MGEGQVKLMCNDGCWVDVWPTKPSTVLVLQATKAGVRRHGDEASIRLPSAFPPQLYNGKAGSHSGNTVDDNLKQVSLCYISEHMYKHTSNSGHSLA